MLVNNDDRRKSLGTTAVVSNLVSAEVLLHLKLMWFAFFSWKINPISQMEEFPFHP